MPDPTAKGGPIRHRHHRRAVTGRARVFTALLAVLSGVAMVLLSLVGTTSSGAAPKPAKESVDICHATPADTGAQGFEPITIDDNGAASKQFAQHADEHDADIIPAFTRADGTTFAGKNLDTVYDGFTGAEILANGCNIPETPTSSTPPPPPDNVKVTLCHARPPDTNAVGYIEITIADDGAGGEFATHANEHDLDIIPAFTRSDGTSFDGKNLDTDFDGVTGAEILANGCVRPTPSSTPPSSTSPAPPTKTKTATKTNTETNTETVTTTAAPPPAGAGPAEAGQVGPVPETGFSGTFAAVTHPYRWAVLPGSALIAAGLLYALMLLRRRETS